MVWEGFFFFECTTAPCSYFLSERKIRRKELAWLTSATANVVSSLHYLLTDSNVPCVTRVLFRTRVSGAPHLKNMFFFYFSKKLSENIFDFFTCS